MTLTSEWRPRNSIQFFQHEWQHGVEFTICNQKKYPTILKYQSNIASRPATGTQGYTMVNDKHLTSLESVRLGSSVHERDLSKLDNRACFAHKTTLNWSENCVSGAFTLTLAKANRAQYHANDINRLYEGSKHF